MANESLSHVDLELIEAAHAAAVASGKSGYIDPESGLFVLTARFLSDRGFCCGNGCRHCPYDKDEASPD